MHSFGTHDTYSHKRKLHHDLVSDKSEMLLGNELGREAHAHGELHVDNEQRDSKKARQKESSRDLKNLHIPQKETKIPAALPPISNRLTIAYGGSHWHARQSFQNIVVFGDSYSKSNEDDTWVDHLRRRIRNTGSDPLKLPNFAFPGATAEDDLSGQLSHFFRTFSSSSKENTSHTRSCALLDPEGTIYCMFLGINDCGTTEQDELDSIVEKIFDALHDLYVKAGARNFVFFDVPPIDRSPQALISESTDVIEDRVNTWNDLLQTHIHEFGTSSGKATIFLFSIHQVLTDVLDDPLEYDFGEDDPTNECGNIWADDLHLTSEVHDILAERLLEALLGSPS